MKRNIMKRAWEIYRTLIGDHIAKLAMAMREAWAEAKAAAKKVFTGFAKIGYDCWYHGSGAEYTTTFKAWNGYGKSRIYINDYKGRTLGYIDVNNDNALVITSDNGNVEKNLPEAVAMFFEAYRLA